MPTRPTVPSFDETRAKTLLAQCDGLVSFTQVVAWDRAAGHEIQGMRAHLSVLDKFAQQLDRFELTCKAAHSQKSLLAWALSSHDHKDWIRNTRKTVQQQRSALPSLIDALQATIDKTPNSRDEQRIMLTELKNAKKQLGQRNREVSHKMKGIRVSARQRSAAVGAGFDVLFSTSKSRRLSRLAIRLNKEAALAPHESEKADLESRINILERTILWLERFRD